MPPDPCSSRYPERAHFSSKLPSERRLIHGAAAYLQKDGGLSFIRNQTEFKQRGSYLLHSFLARL